jgi:glycosyltransferase involved in cell wall biosynthesis
MNTARWLARRGLEVAVLTSGFRGLAAEACVESVRVVRIPVWRRFVNYASAVEVLTFAASGLARGGNVARGFRPDLCLAYHTIPSALVAWRVERRTGAPFLTLLRGQDVPGYPETPMWMHRLAWPLTRFLWKRSRRVIANSEGLAALARRSAPWLDVRVVRNGVDLELYRPAAPNARLPGDALRALYAGRLIRKKRLRELLEAWASVLPKLGERAELGLAGYGPDRPALEAIVAERGIGETVRFLGRLDEPQVVAALQRADVFVNPSEGEGLPNAVLEAMACGLPTVLSDIEPHRELIGPEEAGLFCDGSPASMARAIERLLSDEALRRRLGEAARRRVEREFGWEEATRRLVELFPSSNREGGG